MGIFDMFRKKSRERENHPVYLYEEEELREYEAYVEKSLGSFETVFHEIVSPDIHLDVILIPPTEDAPYIKLVTMGAGAYEMNLPEGMRGYGLERAEYVIFLPADWDLHSSDEKDYWPMRSLKNAGRLALYADTWLGYGHTIQADAEGSPYAENTGFNSIMLVTALDQDGERMLVKLSSGHTICFYQLIPLYPEELAFKKENGADDLAEQLAEIPDWRIVDIGRKQAV